METKNTLDPRCKMCLLAVLVVVLILEPVGLLFSGIFLWILANTDGKKLRRTNRRKPDWLSYSDDAINKPRWSDNSFSSYSSSSNTNNDQISNPAYSHLPSNIFHRH